MKPYEWSEEKNEWLKKERGVGFEDVLVAIHEGKIITIIEHPNQKRYKNQKVYPSYSGLQSEGAAKRIRGVYTESNLSYRSINILSK